MPKVTRRDFIKIGSAAVAGAAVGSKRPAKAMETEVGETSYNYARTAAKREPYYTVSPHGKQKNPLQVFVENEEKVVAVAGHPSHPTTRGRTTAVDAVSHMTSTDPDRILSPLKRIGKRGAGSWKAISWEAALTEISEKAGAAISENRPENICLVRGEDREDGIWKRFMNTIGSSSVYEVSGDRNKKEAQRLTWGQDLEIPDFANARYILNFGSNLYETFPAHAQAVIDGKMDMHAKLVTFDPRMSMTAGLSDEWVPVKPGTDGLVALAMANVIMQEGLADSDFINKNTNINADALAKHLSKFTPEMAEEHSGVEADKITRLAREFASVKPATIFSYRGVSSHANGLYSERACMLLPIITGNIEIKGGYCLPAKRMWNEIEPIPAEPRGAAVNASTLLPYSLKSGEKKADILFVYGTNPAHSAAGAAYWREVLRDEKLIPMVVSIGTHMTKTAEMSDIILPDTTYLERNEPVNNSVSLFPSLAVRMPVVDAPENVLDLPIVLRDLIHQIDEKLDKGLKKYWEFDDTEEWLGRYFEAIPELEEDGVDAVTENGYWPFYGELDIATGKVLNDDELPLEAEYGAATADGFATPSGKIEIYSKNLESRGLEPLPTWVEPDNLKSEKEGLAFVTYKTAYQNGSASLNNKYLAEKSHSNHCMINKETAAELEIKDGALIRITSEAGYIVTKARATNAIHPEVVAMAAGFNQPGIGRVAGADPRRKIEWAGDEDPDVHYNLWWRDTGVNPNDIIPPFVDPAGGGEALSFVVIVEPAHAVDRYGDIRVDSEKLEGLFKNASGQKIAKEG